METLPFYFVGHGALLLTLNNFLLGLSLCLVSRPLPFLESKRKWLNNICLTILTFVVLSHGLKSCELIKQLSQIELQLVHPIVAFELIKALWKSCQYDAYPASLIYGPTIDFISIEMGHHTQNMFWTNDPSFIRAVIAERTASCCFCLEGYPNLACNDSIISYAVVIASCFE